MKAQIAISFLITVIVSIFVTVAVVHVPNAEKDDIVANVFKSIVAWTGIGDLVLYLENEAKPLDENIKGTNYKVYSAKGTSNGTNKEGIAVSYGNLLADVSNNEKWWKWSVKRVSQVAVLGKAFESLKGKSEESNSQDLINACSEVYKKKEEELDWYDKENLWFLCSPLGSKPYSVADIPRWKDIGKFASFEKSHSAYLIADRPANKNVWEVMYDQFFKNKSDISGVFQKVSSGYSSSDEDKENRSLNNVCSELYSQTEEEITDRQSLLKYCSFSNLLSFSENVNK